MLPWESEFPGFRHQILSAPTVVALFGDELESCGFVDTPGSGECALGPEHDFLVASFVGKADAFLDQSFADSQASG